MIQHFFELWDKFIAAFTHTPLKLITTSAVAACTKRLTEWLIDWGVENNKAQKEKSNEQLKQSKLISLAPSHDYVQGLLDDLLSRQKIWIDQGKTEFEVLYRTLGWVLFDFVRPLVGMSWDNIRSISREKEQNKES